MKFLSGIDRLLADRDRLDKLSQRRIGLLTNTACHTADGQSSAGAFDRALATGPKPGLLLLFSPEHGFATEAAAGAAVGDHHDAASGVEIVSLYGHRRVPEPDHLDAIDALAIDLRDVGVRCYTYATTAALTANAALDAGLEVIICDRANPLGAATDGPMLEPALRSFLAYFATPFVHGKTLGDLVTDALRDHPNKERLTVIAASGAAIDDEPWVPPSPALQMPDTVRFYPGLVLFEGTNLSEGRGTPLSFRAIGAPWLDAAALAAVANRWPTGIEVTACEIAPDAGDYAGQILPAVRFERTGTTCDGFGLGVRLLAWIADSHSEFSWRTAPVMPLGASTQETRERPVIDTLLGSDSLRLALGRGDSAEDILAVWRG